MRGTVPRSQMKVDIYTRWKCIIENLGGFPTLPSQVGLEEMPFRNSGKSLAQAARLGI